MRSIFFSSLWLWRQATYTAQCEIWDYFLQERKNHVFIEETEKPKGDEANAKKTEQGVDSFTFCFSCSNWYVSCYVRYHWCLLYLVGGEGVGWQRFQHIVATNLSKENLSGIFYFFSFQLKRISSLARQCYHLQPASQRVKLLCW